MQCPRCAATVKQSAKFCPACGAGLPSWTGRLTEGDLLADRYTVVRPLARGGMGAVYLASDKRLGDAPVALKEMVLAHAAGDTDAWTRAIDEFRREAALLARLSHPNLPRVIDQFEHDDKQFLVMELVDGHTLRVELERNQAPIALETALDWLGQLANVLGYLHKQEPPIIYRDLKPSNVMLRPDGRVALIDFGIARLYKPGQIGDTAVYGTPGYAPPEQYGLGQTDVRSDIYSLAMVLLEILTRFDPCRRSKARPPRADSLRPDIPPHLADAIEKALSIDADDRFQTIEEFMAAVEAPAATMVAAGRSSGAAHKRSATGDPALAGGTAASLWSRLPTGVRWAGAGGLLALLALGLFLAFGRNGGPPATATPTAVAGLVTATTGATASQPTAAPTATPEPPPPPPGMVTLAASAFVFGSDTGEPDEQPAGPAYLGTFFIDRTEVTNAEYQRCVADGDCTPPGDPASATRADYYTNPEYAAFPVVNVTWEQASRYCQAEGKRLPSEVEWERAARGNDSRLYPWGDEWDPGKLNLWQDGDTVAVGLFPAGASPAGAVDMAGNVAEWTSSLDQPYPYNAGDGREVATRPGARIVRGSFKGNSQANARVSNRERRQPTTYANDLGFRCATSEFYAPPGMTYIPGGSWRMGSTEEESISYDTAYGWGILFNEQPATVITTTAFYLDRTEVTNADYSAFISATNHPLPVNSFDPVGLSVWGDSPAGPIDKADHPVVNVTWADAAAYCKWRGKRLPTEAEWERAARGDDGRIWPWGDQWDSAKANTKESGLNGTAPVGSYPAGAGPYGTLDLAGNVWEWTATQYLPYPYATDDGRESPLRMGPRSLRGGSWDGEQAAAHNSGRNSLEPQLANVNVGFRCAQDIGR